MQKEKVQQLLDASPDDIDMDAFMEKVYLLRKIELGELQVEAGELISHKNAKKRLEKWLT